MRTMAGGRFRSERQNALASSAARQLSHNPLRCHLFQNERKFNLEEQIRCGVNSRKGKRVVGEVGRAVSAISSRLQQTSAQAEVSSLVAWRMRNRGAIRVTEYAKFETIRHTIIRDAAQGRTFQSHYR